MPCTIRIGGLPGLAVLCFLGWLWYKLERPVGSFIHSVSVAIATTVHAGAVTAHMVAEAIKVTLWLAAVMAVVWGAIVFTHWIQRRQGNSGACGDCEEPCVIALSATRDPRPARASRLRRARRQGRLVAGGGFTVGQYRPAPQPAAEGRTQLPIVPHPEAPVPAGPAVEPASPAGEVPIAPPAGAPGTEPACVGSLDFEPPRVG